MAQRRGDQPDRYVFHPDPAVLGVIDRLSPLPSDVFRGEAAQGVSTVEQRKHLIHKEALLAWGLGVRIVTLVDAATDGFRYARTDTSAVPDYLDAIEGVHTAMYDKIADQADLTDDEAVVLRYMITGRTIPGGINQAVNNAYSPTVYNNRARAKLLHLNSPLVSEFMIGRLNQAVPNDNWQTIREQLDQGRSYQAIADALGVRAPYVIKAKHMLNKAFGMEYSQATLAVNSEQEIMDVLKHDSMGQRIVRLRQSGFPTNQIVSLLHRPPMEVRLAKAKALQRMEVLTGEGRKLLALNTLQLTTAAIKRIMEDEYPDSRWTHEGVAKRLNKLLRMEAQIVRREE